MWRFVFSYISGNLKIIVCKKLIFAKALALLCSIMCTNVFSGYRV